MTIQQLNIHEEFSLVELIKIFWQQKRLILIITLISLGISIAYLFFAIPVYEAKVSIVGPTAESTSTLNEGIASEKSELTSSELFQIFIESMQSYEIKRNFFEKVYFPSLNKKQKKLPKHTLFDSYLKKIMVQEEQHPSFIKILFSIKADTPSKAKKLAKQYIALAELNAIHKLETLIESKNKTYTAHLKHKIDVLKEVIQANQNDPAVQSNEAQKLSSLFGERFKLQILEHDYDYYTQKASLDKFKLHRLDGAISSPENPIQPKEKLILFLGFLMGLVLSFTIILSRKGSR